MWILKAIGSFMVIFCSGVIGMKSAAALKNRVSQLNGIILSTDKISQYIKIGNAEKDDILKNALPSGIRYEKGYVLIDRNIKIKEEDIKLLKEFFDDLGMGDTDTELVRCNAFKNLFKKQLKEAQKEVDEKHRLFTVSGFLTGIILSFLWW